MGTVRTRVRGSTLVLPYTRRLVLLAVDMVSLRCLSRVMYVEKFCSPQPGTCFAGIRS